jgi:hypothetical protein
MKKADIAAVILVAALTMMSAYWVVNMTFGDPFEKVEKVEYMDAITDNLVHPDSEVFNREAINPTVEVEIGHTEEPQPQAPTETEGAGQ